MFLPSRGGSQGGHVSSFETGGGHWHGGSIGTGGPLAWGGGGVLWSCTPEELSYIHQNHQKPITLEKEGDVEMTPGLLQKFSAPYTLCGSE